MCGSGMGEVCGRVWSCMCVFIESVLEGVVLVIGKLGVAVYDLVFFLFFYGAGGNTSSSGVRGVKTCALTIWR